MIRWFLQMIAALSIALGLCSPAFAQTFTVSSITTTSLGNVAAATTGETAFRINPATGAVTTISGTGARIAATSVRSLVTVRCGNQAACNTANARVTIAVVGTPTNRAVNVRNFTVSTSGASASIVTAPGTGAPITFLIGPVGRNLTKTFWVGFDLPISGDNSAAPTGLSTAQFLVTVSRTDGSRANSRTGLAQANVFRSLSIGKSADLQFGRIIRPSSGAGTVALDQATGSVAVIGVGAIAMPAPAPSAAQFTVSGEGGQAISVTVPGTFTLSGPGGSITVTTNPNVSGAQTLSGTAGSAGNLSVRVGGTYSFSSATATGTYVGTFAVTVQYN